MNKKVDTTIIKNKKRQVLDLEFIPKRISNSSLNSNIIPFIAQEEATLCIYNLVNNESTIYRDLNKLQQIKSVGDNRFFIASYEKLYDCKIKEANVVKVDKVYKFSKSAVEDIDVSEEGDLIALAAYDKVFVVKNGVLTARRLDSSGWYFTSISKNKKYIAFGSNKKILIINSNSFEVHKEYRIDSALHCLKFHPNSKTLIFGDESKNITMLDIESGSRLSLINPEFKVPIKIISLDDLAEFLVFFESNIFYEFNFDKKDPKVIHFDGFEDKIVNNIELFAEKSILISFKDTKKVLIFDL